jgi:hypothetical protein
MQNIDKPPKVRLREASGRYKSVKKVNASQNLVSPTATAFFLRMLREEVPTSSS